MITYKNKHTCCHILFKYRWASPFSDEKINIIENKAARM